MNIANIIVTFIISYYIYEIFFFLFFNDRRPESNKRIDELRSIAVKTPEEQKEFVNLMNPKGKEWYSNLFNFKLKDIPVILVKILLAIFIYKLVQYVLFTVFKLNINWWQGILCFIFIPLIMGYIFSKANIKKDNLWEMIKI